MIDTRFRDAVLPRYTLLERLAVGGMAEVYLAEEMISGRVVALKRLLPTLAGHDSFVAMFRDEHAIASRLRHRNLPEIHGLGHEGDEHYFAMEYIAGLDLRRLIADAPLPWPPARVAYLLGEVCEALQYAHLAVDDHGRRLDLIHRNVTPPNIMVTRSGGVKLIDFVLLRARDRSSVTHPGVVKGVFAYLTPEQVTGQPFDHRVDIYAVGTVLYELVTGVNPFRADTDYATIQRVRAGQVTPPSQVRPELGTRLDAVIARAMARDPEQRYYHAEELASDLAQAVGVMDSPAECAAALHGSSHVP